MKAFAATLLFTGLQAASLEGGYGGYGRRSYGYSRPAYGYSAKLIPVTSYENQTRSKTVYDNVQEQIRVPRTEQRTKIVNDQVKKTVYDTINQTVYDNVSETVYDNVPRKVIDEITKTVIDNVPRKVIDQVKETRIREDIINESNDSGDNYDSDERIYVASVSSNDSDSCDWWGCNKYGSSSSSDDYCDTWNNCVSSNDSISSYIITSDSSDDEKIIRTPVTTTKNVERTVIDKVPRQVKEQRERTVIDRVPRQINKRVPRQVQKRVAREVIENVPRKVTENVTVYDTKTIN